MAHFRNTQETQGSRLFALPQPVEVAAGLAVHCSVVADELSPYRIAIGDDVYNGSSPDAVRSILPLTVRQQVSAYLGSLTS